MLSLSVVEEIARQLASGQLSQREIARRLGVSRATVSAVALGKRGLHGRTAALEPQEPERLDPPERCPKCGYLVHLPCLVCRTREYRRARRVLAALSNGRTAHAPRARRQPQRRRCGGMARVA
ncbi:MAG: helix-turn-helix domain-containing protein [Pirellulales bacterium]